MIFFPVVNEACRVLDEGIVVKAADLDIAAIMGMGFPPYRFVLEIIWHVFPNFIIVHNFGIDILQGRYHILGRLSWI